MKISVFGLGYVGCVSVGCLAKNGNQVIGVDVSQTKVDQINSGKATIIEEEVDTIIYDQWEKKNIRATTNVEEAVLDSEVSIIAVGTPSSDKGHLNLSYIFHVAEDIGKALRNKKDFHVIAIRSTIMPGTCDKFAAIVQESSGKTRNVDFAIVDNPEFLREGTAVKDYYNPPLTLIGSDSPEAAEKIASLYRQLPAEVVITDLKVAEIMKYINNTYHALKISFANEVGNICKELNIDSHKVMEIFCSDKQLNISPYYFKPGFAYGGSCLPKDLKGLQTLAHDLYVTVPVIDNIHETNTIQIQRAIKLIYKYWNKKLAFLGLSFKAGTDDLRNSPAVEVIEFLLGKGCDISIYDKNINLSMITGTNKEFINSKIPHLANLMVQDAAALVDDAEVIIINTREPDFMELLKGKEDKIIIDLVRLNSEIMKYPNYIGLNW
ncbi:MAG: UDP-glucose/GDP-mannose dehydrogenase family protein [Sphingobacteriaceae bacterium]|nr:MAG: UDP-glucose/GDP-mannose dehydrogenase family protein [Sphingobacteriaceae bacterium]